MNIRMKISKSFALTAIAIFIGFAKLHQPLDLRLKPLQAISIQKGVRFLKRAMAISAGSSTRRPDIGAESQSRFS